MHLSLTIRQSSIRIYRLLVKLPPGWAAAKQTVKAMSEYIIDPNIWYKDIKDACATTTVMEPEALSINDVGLVFRNLDQATRLETEQIGFQRHLDRGGAKVRHARAPARAKLLNSH